MDPRPLQRMLRLLCLGLGVMAFFDAIPSVAGSPCSDQLMTWIEGGPEIRAKSVLKRALSQGEITALTEARSLTQSRILTPEQLEKQTAILQAAGFEKAEIASLRERGLLESEVIQWQHPIPREVDEKTLELIRPGGKLLSEKGRVYGYVVDDRGNLFLLDEPTAFAPEKLWWVKNSNSDAAEGSRIIQEAGTVTIAKNGEIRLRADYGIDLSREETQSILKAVEAQAGEARVARSEAPGITKSKLLECAEVLKAPSASSFLVDRLVATNMVTVTSVAVTELGGAGRLKTEEGREMVRAEMIWTNLATVLSESILGPINARGVSLPVMLLARGTTSFGVLQLKKPVLEQVISPKNAEERAKKVVDFDTKWVAARFAITAVEDHLIRTRLPSLMFNLCSRDSKLKMFISPRSLRIVDSYVSSIIYFGLRKQVTGE